MPELNLGISKQKDGLELLEDVILEFERNKKVFVLDCGEAAAQWISHYLVEQPSGYRLAYNDCLSNDLETFLLINQASVNDLTAKIPQTGFSVHNFRPNIVVDGPNLRPFEENFWKVVKIGGAVFRLTTPCNRCSVTTYHPDTVAREKHNEPLTTLRTYRKIKEMKELCNAGEAGDDDVSMGMYLKLIQSATINVGDEIFIGED